MICRDFGGGSLPALYSPGDRVTSRLDLRDNWKVITDYRNHGVGTECDQLVNICSFAVRCDRRWPRTQWHRIYTGSGNMPYVQFGSVSDFIPEPRCSKFAVGLQMRRRKMGCARGPVGSNRKGQERQELCYELSVQACAWGPNLVVLWLWTRELGWPNESEKGSSKGASERKKPLLYWRERIPFYR